MANGVTRRCAWRGLALLLLGCGGKAGSDGFDAQGGATSTAANGGALTSHGGAPMSHGGAALASGGVSAAGSNTGGSGELVLPGEEFVPVTPEQRTQASQDACFGSITESEYLPLANVLSIETSSSMERIGAGQTTNDLDVVKTGLLAALSEWAGPDALGVSFFPNRSTSPNFTWSPPNACIDSSADVPARTPTVRDSLTNAVSTAKVVPGSGTPLRDAYQLAAGQLDALPDYYNKLATLFTAGSPTLDRGCVGADDPLAPESLAGLLDDIASAATRRIRTIVVGTPSSQRTEAGLDARPWLSRAARAGETARTDCNDDGPNYCHVDLSTAPDTTQAIKELVILRTKPTWGCTFAIPPPPSGIVLDLTRAAIFIDTRDGVEMIRQTNSAACEAGWRLDPIASEIVLCPATCERLQAKDVLDLTVLFFCSA